DAGVCACLGWGAGLYQSSTITTTATNPVVGGCCGVEQVLFLALLHVDRLRSRLGGGGTLGGLLQLVLSGFLGVHLAEDVTLLEEGPHVVVHHVDEQTDGPDETGEQDGQRHEPQHHLVHHLHLHGHLVIGRCGLLAGALALLLAVDRQTGVHVGGHHDDENHRCGDQRNVHP